MKKNKTKILVIGGSGFIGSEIISIISKLEAFKVSNMDLLQNNFQKNIDFIQNDITNLTNTIKYTKGFDYIFHLGGMSDLDKAKNDPINAVNLNVVGTLNVLESVKINKIKKLIFASSMYASGSSGSFYRISKKTCEELIKEYSLKYKLNYSILRFGTIYGPSKHNSNMIYHYISEAINNNKINVKGTGSEVREYIHVHDAALHSIECIHNHNNQIVLITGNNRFKLQEVMEMIREILNKKISIRYGSQKKAHYKLTPYSFNDEHIFKITKSKNIDFGQGLIDIIKKIKKI